MKRDFFYDEEVISERIYRNGFEDGYSYWQAKMVAKYLRWTLGYGDAKTKSALVEFCVNHDPHYVIVRQSKSTSNAVNASKEFFVKKASPISITQNELNTIRTIKNFKAQKILLGFLIFCKRDDGYINRRNWVQVKRIMSVSVTHKEIKNFIRIYYQTGIIEIKGGSHLLNFIDNNSESMFVISNEKALYSMGNIYKNYCGGELVWCKECGEELVKSGKNHGYCDDCSKNKELEKFKRYYRKSKMK